MEIQVHGLPQLREKLVRLDEAMKDRVHKALESEAEAMKNAAKSLSPVRTGYLRSTIFSRVQEWTLRLGATAPYAAYQEFGTRRIRPRRFLSRAVELRIHGLIDRINQAIQGSVLEASR